MPLATLDDDAAAQTAREALYDELRSRALARRDWARLVRLLHVSLVAVTLLIAALILDYDLEVLGRLGVSLNLFPS